MGLQSLVWIKTPARLNLVRPAGRTRKRQKLSILQSLDPPTTRIVGGKAEGPIQPEIGGGSAAASGVCGEEGLKGWGLAVADLKG
jgi:hypothetical protein